MRLPWYRRKAEGSEAFGVEVFGSRGYGVERLALPTETKVENGEGPEEEGISVTQVPFPSEEGITLNIIGTLI